MGRKSKADVRKKEILENFYHVLKDIGFENASIAKIADRMDVNPSLLIHYFKSKEAMVEDLVNFILDRFEAAFSQSLDGVETPQERFNHIISMIFGTEWLEVIDHSVFYACYYLKSRNEKILERFRVLYDRFSNFLEDEAKTWVEAGIVKGHQPTEIAEYLIVMNEGITFYHGIRQDKEAYARRAAYLKKVALATFEVEA
ncbi:MAG: TetR/AcrR family transcriptional regulator [Saprospiraceae bacterium]|nr:TetR/AcrR family transcriptional regulator [Saprospiraceae bacterium]